MVSPETDWRKELQAEIDEMRVSFLWMAEQSELDPEDRATLMNFSKVRYIPMSVMAEIYMELLVEVSEKLGQEESQKMKEHLIGVFTIGPLSDSVRGNRSQMLIYREWDPMREMLGIPTSDNPGTTSADADEN